MRLWLNGLVGFCVWIAGCAPHSGRVDAAEGSGAPSANQGSVAPIPSNRAASDAPTPVVVELFSSEGCSSCPPAESVLGELLANPPVATRVLAIELHVDYWDRLGHVDRFASPEYTARQKDYASKLKGSSIYTPQAVVDGQTQLVGSRKAALAKAIEEAAAKPHVKLSLTFDPNDSARVTIQTGALPEGTTGAHLIFAQIQSHLATQVSAGENAGSTLQHTWVATSLIDLGEIAAAGAVQTSGPVTLGDNRGVLAWIAIPESGAIIGSGDLLIPR